ncbi:MAG: PAS domain S-box protein [Candidatus Heimdallarchaeota archaeon]|nr:MAG: PAS domain S-box protein [Candidatus Heimdallarchaeota archaeon]
MGRNDLYPQEQIIDFIDQVIVNVSSSGVFVLDRNTAKIITGNDIFAQIHGYTSIKDLHGKVYWDLLLPMDIQSPLTTFQQSGYFQGEVRAFLRGKNIILLDFTILDIQRYNIILGLIREITEQHNFLKRLQESEARYRAFVENLREGLLILDKQENIAFVNPIICRSLGYTKAELMNKNFSKITYTDGFQAIKAQIRGREESARQIEVKMISKIGRDRIFLISAAPLFDSQSGYTGSIMICIDITDRYLGIQKIADDQGALLRMMIAESSEQLLLTQGWLDIIKSSLPEQHERIEKLVKIIEKVIRFNNQITELRQINSIIKSPLLHVSIPELMAEINKIITPVVSSKDCRVKFNLQLEQSYLYECPRILTIAVEQIIQNSITRSCQEIVIDVKPTSDNQLSIIITDDGRTFLKTPDPPDSSKFLMDIYLSDVLLREIGGKLTVTDILPKEGLQFSLLFPSKIRES